MTSRWTGCFHCQCVPVTAEVRVRALAFMGVCSCLQPQGRGREPCRASEATGHEFWVGWCASSVTRVCAPCFLPLAIMFKTQLPATRVIGRRLLSSRGVYSPSSCLRALSNDASQRHNLCTVARGLRSGASLPPRHFADQRDGARVRLSLSCRI